MSQSSSHSNGGIGFCDLLTIAFIVLKLLDKIDWSWWWVLAPSWIPLAIAGLILGGMGVAFVAKAVVEAYQSRAAMIRRQRKAQELRVQGIKVRMFIDTREPSKYESSKGEK